MFLIAGPTASGKSALAIEWAERTGGVIVNADASQIYGDLPILSAAAPFKAGGRGGPDYYTDPAGRLHRDPAVKVRAATVPAAVRAIIPLVPRLWSASA